MRKKIISITQNSRFRRLYRRGKSAVTPTLVMYVAKRRDGEKHLGLTAGKKVGGAVARNRAKRRLRELFRDSMGQIAPGFDFCIVARSFTVRAPYAKLVCDFQTAARNLGVWIDENSGHTAD